jgi:hypothetical protein
MTRKGTSIKRLATLACGVSAMLGMTLLGNATANAADAQLVSICVKPNNYAYASLAFGSPGDGSQTPGGSPVLTQGQCWGRWVQPGLYHRVQAQKPGASRLLSQYRSFPKNSNPCIQVWTTNGGSSIGFGWVELSSAEISKRRPQSGLCRV